MNTQEFFKKWTSTRPNLKASFHDAGIEAMAFADAYYKHKLSERNKSTETSDKRDSKQLNILDVSKRFDFDKLLQDYRQEFVNGGGYSRSDRFENNTDPYEVFEWFKQHFS